MLLYYYISAESHSLRPSLVMGFRLSLLSSPLPVILDVVAADVQPEQDVLQTLS